MELKFDPDYPFHILLLLTTSYADTYVRLYLSKAKLIAFDTLAATALPYIHTGIHQVLGLRQHVHLVPHET